VNSCFNIIIISHTSKPRVQPLDQQANLLRRDLVPQIRHHDAPEAHGPSRERSQLVLVALDPHAMGTRSSRPPCNSSKSRLGFPSLPSTAKCSPPSSASSAAPAAAFSGSDESKFYGGVLLPDGRLVFVP
jgi:hypothetical protein